MMPRCRSRSRPCSSTRALPDPGVGPLIEAAVSTWPTASSTRRPHRGELLAGAADADALLCMLTERVDAELLERAPELRVVANLAVGYDNIDVAAATDRGVVRDQHPRRADRRHRRPGLGAAAGRRPPGGRGRAAGARAGEWTGVEPAPAAGRARWPAGPSASSAWAPSAGRSPGGRAASGWRCSTPTATANPEAAQGRDRRPAGRRSTSCWPPSDVVSLHAPLNAESRHLIDADALARMKPTAILVNTARGPLVDEAALVEALRDGTIAAAGLDVFEREPPLAPGLAELDNVVLLPHIGSATTAARAAMVELCCDNIVAVLSGRAPLTRSQPRRPPPALTEAPGGDHRTVARARPRAGAVLSTRCQPLSSAMTTAERLHSREWRRPPARSGATGTRSPASRSSGPPWGSGRTGSSTGFTPGDDLPAERRRPPGVPIPEPTGGPAGRRRPRATRCPSGSGRSSSRPPADRAASLARCRFCRCASVTPSWCRPCAPVAVDGQPRGRALGPGAPVRPGSRGLVHHRRCRRGAVRPARPGPAA